MTSYAPLFKNVAYTSWEPDMIVFNNHDDYAIPSYYMLKMFGENRGDYVCKYEVTTKSDKQKEKGGFCIFAESGDISSILIDNMPCENIRNLGETERLAGDKNKNSQKLSVKLKTENEKIHIRFWDNFVRGEDQNFYDWTVNGSISRVVHYNGWSNEVICGDTNCTLERENTIEIVTDGDSFEITLNGVILHRKILAEIPHITAVCTVDTKNSEIITKLVNFSENEITVNISADRKMHDSAVMTTLTGASYYAKNTFEEKKAVYPYTEIIEANSDYNTVIKPRSVNVIRHKMTE